MRPLLHFGPNVITDGTFIMLGSTYYACALYGPLHIINGYTANRFTYLYPLVGCLINTKYLHVGSSNNVRHFSIKKVQFVAHKPLAQH